MRGGFVLDEQGELRSVSDIDWRTEPPCVLVGLSLAAFTSDLTERYRDDPLFQWKATSPSESVLAHSQIHKTIVDYFGWRAGEWAKRAGHWHKCLDPDVFYANPWTMDGYTDTIQDLMTWAINIRDFCRDNDLVLRSTAASVAAQFLKDPRFYPEARRKVPKVINATAREWLPGNYYKLCVPEGSDKSYQALEIDQTRAHHYHAQHVRMPDGNSLTARGDFTNAREVVEVDEPDGDFSGLYKLRLFDSRAGYDEFQLFRGNPGGFFDEFVWSSELPFLRDSGFTVGGIIAAWGSYHNDTGIRSYSLHAQHELDRLDNAYWIKPLLLSVYGLLACKPKVPSAVYRIANGEPISLVTNRDWLHGFMVNHTKGKEIEPVIANVLHRGLIEAATRAESLGFARYLTENRVKVLQIYADCVMVEEDHSTPLPFMPDPWRVKTKLTDFMPLNPQAFVSVEKERLPGVSRQDRLRISHSVGTVPTKPRYDWVDGHRLSAQELAEKGLTATRI